ncbi:hypothetical protein BKA56DRAFT_588997 [Ilyonectria sp. MPI-CAGE-AT-0026]|nr:hypothetical protein BKA56DRAFT_588997 [Ilyonectria sp. MPI-CAGE-AT-0026]
MLPKIERWEADSSFSVHRPHLPRRPSAPHPHRGQDQRRTHWDVSHHVLGHRVLQVPKALLQGA